MNETKKITLQEIADIVGVSRNTVSKIVNGRFKGSPEVMDRVLKLMREHDYKGMGQFEHEQEREPEIQVKTIMLLTKGDIAQSSFFVTLINEIQKSIAEKGYVLMFTTVYQHDIESRHIPMYIEKKKVDGILCMELFEHEYIEKLVSYGIPTVFLEFCYDIWNVQGNFDVVMMSNEYPVSQLTREMIAQGCNRIGYVGDYKHCRGFFERYQGYQNALQEAGIMPDKDCCITVADGSDYFDKQKVWNCLKKMNPMPQGFVVANDALAICLIETLKEHGYDVKKDFSIVAFDDIEEATKIEPSLTTVNSNTDALCKMMVSSLLTRMDMPNKPRTVVYVDSKIVYRDSFKVLK